MQLALGQGERETAQDEAKQGWRYFLTIFAPS